jgi:hypothetical protein
MLPEPILSDRIEPRTEVEPYRCHPCIERSPSIDTGGIWRTRINQVFEALLHSDLFDHTAEGELTFAEYPSAGFSFRHGRYFVLGRLFYWSVFIGRDIPYPRNISQAIVHFAIHGTVPRSVTSRRGTTEAIANIAGIIEGYTFTTTIDNISGEVKYWVGQLGINMDDFMADLHHPSRGPLHISERLSTSAVLGTCAQAFWSFKKGFNSERGFESV